MSNSMVKLLVVQTHGGYFLRVSRENIQIDRTETFKKLQVMYPEVRSYREFLTFGGGKIPQWFVPNNYWRPNNLHDIKSLVVF